MSKTDVPRDSETGGAPRVSCATYNQVKTYADYVLLLPAPDDDFAVHEYDWLDKQLLRKLQSINAIESVGEELYDPIDHDGGGSHYIWSVKREAYNIAREVVSNRDTFFEGCDHSGLVNCGDHYECGFDECDKQYSRDEVQR